MEVAAKDNLAFNSKKCIIPTHKFVFFGSVCTDEGAKPDPNKMQDKINMPAPPNKDELQRFTGTIQYLAPYIP